MSPAQAKRQQHKRYNEIARRVARGQAGYKPAIKSPLSKSGGAKFSHRISFA